MKQYEKTVMDHYTEVALNEKASETSTMKDLYVRNKETQSIINVISNMKKSKKFNNKKMTIMDVGCGNGYTLSELKKIWPQDMFIGIEKNDDLRKIADERFSQQGIKVIAGDVRYLDKACTTVPDVIISQRVIINLLDNEDQYIALQQLKRKVADEGIVILIECFNEPLRILNQARAEFDLKEITPSFHNLYLDEDSFQKIFEDEFCPYHEAGINSNFLSGHYYVSRVLHDVMLQGKPFVRNSHFVKVMSEIIPDEVGDYSPIKMYVFQRKTGDTLVRGGGYKLVYYKRCAA